MARRRSRQSADDGIDIQGIRRFLELIAPLEIEMLPRDRGDLLGCLRTLRIPASFLVLQEPGKDRGVVKDGAVGDQAAAFRPEFLLVLGLEAKLAEPGVRDGA